MWSVSESASPERGAEGSAADTFATRAHRADVEASWRGATLDERLAHVRDHIRNYGTAAHSPDTLRPSRARTSSARPSSARPSSASPSSVGPSSSSQDEVLAPWARACAFGSLEGLRRRLSWDGIDIDVAVAAMDASAPADFPLAEWVHRRAELVADAEACATTIGTPAWDADLADVGRELPFVEVWLPVLLSARRRLSLTVPTRRDWLSAAAIRALEVQLLRELSRVGELTLLEDFRARIHARDGMAARAAGELLLSPVPASDGYRADIRPVPASDGYRAYIRQLLAARYAELLDAFPVLTRHAVLLADQWVQQISVLVSRQHDDRAAIEATFEADAGQIQRLTPALSDRHAGGCRVAAVELSSGLRLAYKPRDVRLERIFNDWLLWLRRSGLDVVPRPLRVIDRGAYGWVEWAEQKDLASIDAVHAYFRSAGALVCLTHVLGGLDLHSENLVATSDGPVLIDTEMLLQPATLPLKDPSARDDDADGGSLHSCLSSGLVSRIVVDKRGTPFDVGGLQQAPARELKVPMRRWLDLQHDAIRFEPVHRVHPMLRNDVRLHGEVQRPEDFVDDVCAGYEATYRFLEANRVILLAPDGPLRGFAECRLRLLFRPSDEYATAQYVLAAPRYQRRGLDRSLAIETFARVFAGEVERPRLWPLVHDGRPPLESLDIPRPTLRADATDLEAPTGEVVRNLYAHSGIEATRRRLSALSADDLAYQIDQLRTALANPLTPTLSPLAGRGGTYAASDALGAAAESVGLALLRRAHHGPDGSLRWTASRGRVDLYSGASGIALFFAALAAASRRETWRDAAQQVLRGVDTETRESRGASEWRIGACTGLPSVAYAMVLAGQLLGDANTIARAGELAASIPGDAIDTDPALDIEGGAAGALVALLAVDAVRADDRLIEQAGRCVSRLRATQIRNGPDRGAWPAGEQAQPLPGFAHGAAGIAYALCRWFARTGDTSVCDLVRNAWDFERRIFAEHGRAWPAIRRDGGRIVLTAWCHGAPGIALARAAAPAALADPELAGEIESAIGQTLSQEPAPLDHLCCGNLGRADATLTVGLRTDTTMWIDAARTMARTVAARIMEHGRLGMRGKGFHVGAPAPEFFQGLAGIGYQLLRAAAPSLIPSVLAFETATEINRRPVSSATPAEEPR
jgi:type 2 lantibiotic biosynthesis protein LanM